VKLLAQFDLDVFPPTANLLQRSSRTGIRYDTAEYKAFKAQFAAMVGKRLAPLKAHEGMSLSLAVVYRWSGWFTKSGENRKGRDVSNRYKALEDAVFKAIGMDDAYNVMPLMQKAHPESGRDKYVECRIYDTERLGLWDLLEKTH